MNPIATTVSVSMLTHAAENGGSGSFRLERLGTISTPLTVNFAISGTATSGADFSSMGTSVEFFANSATVDIFVDTLPDNLVEGTETVVFTVTSGTGYMPDGSPATVNIADSPAVVSMTATSATENGSAGGFTFTRTGGAPAQALAFNYTIGGTAIADTDYIAPPRELSFAANESSVALTVDPLNDDDVEGTETVSVTLAASPNYTIGTTTTTANVSDDDTASLPETPIVSVVPGGDAVRGGVAAGWFLVARFGNLAAPLTVNLSVGGTATPGTDYTALPSTVTFPANVSTVSVPVNAPNGTPAGSTEDVSLAVASGTGYTVSTTSNTAIIIVYDPPPPGGPPPVVGSGGGLFARYYNTKELYDLKTTRIDDNINFNWGNNAPTGTDVGADHFSVSWVGQVQAPITANYFFHTVSDDGIRVWVEVDESYPPTINDWNIHAPNPIPTSSVGFALAAGQKYNIRVEYFENTGGASVQLLWSNSVNPAKVVIPKLQLYPVAFDLDVNVNNSIRDAIDGANDYLPGYEGNVPKVSTNGSFNTDTYTGQRMKLVLDGVGKDDATVTKVVFVITQISNHAGYASNRTHTSIAVEDQDYSFLWDRNDRVRTIDRNTVQQNGYGGVYDGRMEATETWVNFYAKDYGGFATVEARVYKGGANPDYSLRLVLPRDTEPKTDGSPPGDGLADKWEIQMGKRRTTQYGLPAYTVPQALADISYLRDHEDANPDGLPDEQRPLRAQFEQGDAHEILEEYRGYILDGGGLDGAGANGHPGGHIRLDPARKEILVEVDRAATLNNVSGTGTLDQKVNAILNGASGVFSQAQRGAGIYMYWLMDRADLPLGNVLFADEKAVITLVQLTRKPALTSDFMHLVLIDDGITAVYAGTAAAGAVAATFEKRSTDFYAASDPNNFGTVPQQLAARGSIVATTDVHFGFSANDFPKRAELLMITIAHELTHNLLEKRTGAFTTGEHTTDPNGVNGPGDVDDKASVLNDAPPAKEAYQLATVKFFPVVQAELRTKTGEWGTHNP